MIQRGILPERSLSRGLLMAVLGAGAVAALTQFVLPGRDQVGTPAAIVLQGIVLGLVNGMITAGIILIYRTTRVINFAQAALGGAGGLLAYSMMSLNRWHWGIAVASGLLLAAIVGLILGLLLSMKRFFTAPRLVLAVATIGMGPLLGYFSGLVTTLPIFPPVSDRSAAQVAGTEQIRLPFRNWYFTVGDLPVRFHFGHVSALLLAVAGLLALAWFLRYTRMGRAVRAASQNPDRAELLGIPIKGLVAIVWTIAGALSGLGVILTVGLNRAAPDTGVNVPLLLPALTAAVVARMRSLPVAAGAALAITVVQQGIRYSFEQHLALLDLAMLAIILFSLLVQREQMQRSEEREGGVWEAHEEVRPTPKTMLAVPGVVAWRWALAGVAVVAAFVIFPLAGTQGQLNTGAFVAIMGIVFLSLVVLTGWAAQISLGQLALTAIAAVVGGALMRKTGISFWLVIPAVTIFTAAFATLIGLPALRVKGLFLGITTLAFALVVQSAVFNREYFGWLLPDRVDRPTLFFFDFEDERSMYYLSLIGLAVAILVVTSLRRTRTGRVLIGLRENESNLQSFGVPVVRTRLTAFAISGALCGFAGVFLAAHQRALTPQSFQASDSLNVFIAAVIGGVSSVSGALAATGYLAATNALSGFQIGQFLSNGGALLLILAIRPGGLASIAYGMRDAALRIVAQRRRMVVPALFADMDAEAIELRIAPLADNIPNTGLGALPAAQRYRVASPMYMTRGRISARRERARERLLFEREEAEAETFGERQASGPGG